MKQVDVELDRRLGEREEARTHAHVALLAEQLADELEHRPRRSASVMWRSTARASTCRNDRRVRRVRRVAAVTAAGRDHVDRRLARQHRPDLIGRGVGAQDGVVVEIEGVVLPSATGGPASLVSASKFSQTVATSSPSQTSYPRPRKTSSISRRACVSRCSRPRTTGVPGMVTSNASPASDASTRGARARRDVRRVPPRAGGGCRSAASPTRGRGRRGAPGRRRTCARGSARARLRARRRRRSRYRGERCCFMCLPIRLVRSSWRRDYPRVTPSARRSGTGSAPVRRKGAKKRRAPARTGAR